MSFRGFTLSALLETAAPAVFSTAWDEPSERKREAGRSNSTVRMMLQLL
jgi:hypothetical protein